MRQTLLFTIALIAGMMLAGCSKDSENMAIFTIDTESISLLVNDDYKVTPSGVFTARSSDEDVATVSADGVIRGVSAGDADIIFTSVEDGQTQTCKVSVDWRYKYFDEPILDFTMSLKQVKERETHPFLLENAWDAAYSGFPEATNPFLVRFDYRIQEIPMIACYTFLDKDNEGVGTISLEMLKAELQKASQQLEERYGSPSDVGGHIVYFNKRKNYYILLTGKNIFYSIKPLISY